MTLASHLDCPLSLETAHMGNPGETVVAQATASVEEGAKGAT